MERLSRYAIDGWMDGCKITTARRGYDEYQVFD